MSNRAFVLPGAHALYSVTSPEIYAGRVQRCEVSQMRFQKKLDTVNSFVITNDFAF
jgi:hypothetical protein